MIVAWKRLENVSLSCNKYRNLTLGLGLETKEIGGDVI